MVLLVVAPCLSTPASSASAIGISARHSYPRSSNDPISTADLDAELKQGLAKDTVAGLPRALGAWDSAPVYRNGCHTSWTSTTVRPCSLGAPSGPLVVVTGDSHAAQLQPMFSA